MRKLAPRVVTLALIALTNLASPQQPCKDSFESLINRPALRKKMEDERRHRWEAERQNLLQSDPGMEATDTWIELELKQLSEGNRVALWYLKAFGQAAIPVLTGHVWEYSGKADAALSGLEAIGEPAIPTLCLILTDFSHKNQDRTRVAVLGILDKMGMSKVIERLVLQAADESAPPPQIPRMPLKEFGKSHPEIVNALITEIQDDPSKEDCVRSNSISLFRRIGDATPEVVPFLIQSMNVHPSCIIRDEAAWALGEISPRTEEIRAALEEVNKDRTHCANYACSQALLVPVLPVPLYRGIIDWAGFGFYGDWEAPEKMRPNATPAPWERRLGWEKWE